MCAPLSATLASGLISAEHHVSMPVGRPSSRRRQLAGRQAPAACRRSQRLQAGVTGSMAPALVPKSCRMGQVTHVVYKCTWLGPDLYTHSTCQRNLSHSARVVVHARTPQSFLCCAMQLLVGQQHCPAPCWPCSTRSTCSLPATAGDAAPAATTAATPAATTATPTMAAAAHTASQLAIHSPHTPGMACTGGGDQVPCAPTCLVLDWFKGMQHI
jgi:hypothetical protein